MLFVMVKWSLWGPQVYWTQIIRGLLRLMTVITDDITSFITCVKTNFLLPTAYDGRLCFQSVHHRGGGGVLPHLHPIIFPFDNTSTGSMSFLGGISVTVPRSLPGEVPQSQIPDGGYPRPIWGTSDLARSGWGTSLARDGVPPSGQVRVAYPHQEWGAPGQGWGTLIWPGRDGGTPQPGMGYPQPGMR